MSTRKLVRLVPPHAPLPQLIRVLSGIGSIIVVGMLLSSSAAAQQEAVGKADTWGGGFFALGVQSVPLGELGSAMASAGHPSPENPAVTIGGGGYGQFGRLRVGGEGHALLISTPSEGEFHTDVSGGYGLFTLGYDLTPGGRVALVPTFGVGGGQITVHVVDTDGDTFSVILHDPGREVRLNRGGLLGTVSAVLEGRVGSPHKRKTFALGLEAGYVFSLYQKSWRYAGTTVTGGPEAAPSGPFIRLRLGKATNPLRRSRGGRSGER